MNDLTAGELLATIRRDGGEVRLVGDDELKLQATSEESLDFWLPIVTDRVNEVLEHLRTNAYAVRAAEAIIRSPGGCC